MEIIEARILLKNLVNRIKTQDDGSKVLNGVVTEDELQALQMALELLNAPPPGAAGAGTIPAARSLELNPIPYIPSCAPVEAAPQHEPKAETKTQRHDHKHRQSQEPLIKLDLRALTSPKPPASVRLCLDFGTAMSKATLVADDEDAELENIHVLRLGIPGDQQEISETMLVSSVYIDNTGLLWFGKAAVDHSKIEGDEDGSRQRLDNIKRRLSEEGWDEEVGNCYNPTGLRITHGDMVLAYLMYLTWAVNSCLEQLNYPWNLRRRFAMPCLSGAHGRETVHRLSKAVGEAQVLADTFYQTLKKGIPLADFLAAVKALREVPRSYDFVAEDITEPLGVAGSIMSWKSPVDMLIMVVDVGAGTSDLSLFRIHFNPDTGNSMALEVKDASRGIQVAGNHLDRMLIELIIKKLGVTSQDPMWLKIRSELEPNIRDIKETLFNEGSVFVLLHNNTEIEIELAEFLTLEPVRQFGERLRMTMIEILESIHESWVNWVMAHPTRRLVIALTGGGAELPMVKSLAEGSIQVNGHMVPVAKALSFPTWLRDIDEGLEADYPRIAVSLGGARKRLIPKGKVADITAGDGTRTPVLDGYYTRGN